MKDRYKLILLFGATCIVIMLVYFWLSSNHESQHRTLSTPVASPHKKKVVTSKPTKPKPLAEKYKSKSKLKNDISKHIYTEFTVNTTGCHIPLTKVNYTEYYKAEADKKIKSKLNCGNRAVYLNKVDVNTVKVNIDMVKMKKIIHDKKCTNFRCHYQFFNESTRPGEELKSGRRLYNDQNITLESDFINVRCGCANHNNYVTNVYDDLFAFIKEKNTTQAKRNYNHCNYNVLMLGMESMSLARLQQTMPKTFSFLNRSSALSFRGYHKVGDNTFPNLMAALSGHDQSTIKEHCRKSIHLCQIIWKRFKEIGYTTAYGEDFLGLPETFGRNYAFNKSPTDHHLRPLFLREETEINKTIICTGKAFAGQQLLEYATDFVSTYQNGRFFGVFWINSFSHNENSRPQDADRLLESFFNNTIGKRDILKNTFVIFFSDQGPRFEKNRMRLASYYEERLPFLFILPPKHFKEKHPRELNFLKINQRRLVTPYDLYNTLYHIYNLSKCMNESRRESLACHNCHSLFTPISTNRTCKDVKIVEKWCSCHQLNPLNQQNYLEGMNSVLYAVSEVQKKIKSIKTRSGWICADISLAKVIRIHFYYDEIKKSRYFVVAFTTTPGNVSFEATISRLKIVSLSVISPYGGLGNCTLDTSIHIRLYCYCKINKACLK